MNQNFVRVDHSMSLGPVPLLPLLNVLKVNLTLRKGTFGSPEKRPEDDKRRKIRRISLLPY